jgi:hypothetical protein
MAAATWATLDMKAAANTLSPVTGAAAAPMVEDATRPRWSALYKQN